MQDTMHIRLEITAKIFQSLVATTPGCIHALSFKYSCTIMQHIILLGDLDRIVNVGSP